MGRNKTKRSVISTAILLFIVIAAVFLFLHSSFFKIEQVYVTGLDRLTAEEIMALAGIETGQNIFRIDSGLIAKSVKVHPVIKEVTVVRHLPSAVEIKVVERTVWAVIPYQDSFLCIDDTGVCIEKTNRLSLNDGPIITMDVLPERVNAGQQVDAEAVEMIRQIWSKLPDEDRKQISDFHYINNDKQVLIYTLKGTLIKFGDLERMDEKINHFNEIIAMEDIEALEYVDLRFSGQPVIKTKI